jgi:molybdenum-dependent DNA-binding transcriptional regulator ModE
MERGNVMTLQQLRYIIKIVECGSITEAAKQLYITQPSLSAAVKELEKELGIEIFYRTTKGISLSADGTEFLSYARQVTEQTELMEQRYDRYPTRLVMVGGPAHNALWNWITQIFTGKVTFATTFSNASILGAAMIGYGSFYDKNESTASFSVMKNGF